MAWPARTVTRLPFPPGVKNPQMLGLRRVRGSQLCPPRSYGRVPHTSYVFIGSAVEERLMGGISQSSSALFFFDAVTVHFASAISIILVVYGLYAFEGRGVTPAGSQTIALLVRRRVSPHLPVISHHRSSFLAFCSPGPPCHTLHSHHISLHHSSCSLSSSPVPVTSSSLIKYHFLPLNLHRR